VTRALAALLLLGLVACRDKAPPPSAAPAAVPEPAVPTRQLDAAKQAAKRVEALQDQRADEAQKAADSER
jgi:hypothetical protein